jgi:putative YhbY family RNA-binding protein
MLRARAHHLQPVVSIGANGLTRAVLHEIDVNLLAHELVKVRVFGDDRNERERLLAQVCAGLDAAPVQHLGKTLTLWRPSPGTEPVPGIAKTRSAGASRPRRRATR